MKSCQQLYIYQYTCTECDSSYIDSSSRHLNIRIDEHMKGFLFDHHTACNRFNIFHASFKTLCSNIHFYKKLLITEALYIKMLKPILNMMHTTPTTYHTHILKML